MEFLFDMIENVELASKSEKAALDCFASVGCKDFGRVDFILDSDDEIYVLEVNTLPGMTSHSLMPKAASKAGYSMSDFYVKIVKMALGQQ